MSVDQESSDASLRKYAEIVSAFRTAVSDEDFESISRALAEYYASVSPLPPVTTRMHVLRSALVQSMGALN